MWNLLWDVLFPPKCMGCNNIVNRSELSINLCPECVKKLHFIEGAYCPDCKTPFADPKKHNCSQAKKQRHDFDLAISVLEYTGEIRRIHHKFKFKGRMVFAESLANLMICRLESITPLPEFDCVIPVPLSKKRMEERQYNQSALIAEKIAVHFKTEYLPRGVARVKDTLPQHTLSSHERVLNVYGAFDLPDPRTISGKNILLIDDIFTTGITVSEVSRVLKLYGADKVTVFTFAATVLNKGKG